MYGPRGARNGAHLVGVGTAFALVRGQVVVTNPVPEPSALTLMGLGLLGFGVTRRKQKKK